MVTEEQKNRILNAMGALAEVNSGCDFEVECHNIGILLGHVFNIYNGEVDKEHAEFLIKEGLD